MVLHAFRREADLYDPSTLIFDGRGVGCEQHDHLIVSDCSVNNRIDLSAMKCQLRINFLMLNIFLLVVSWGGLIFFIEKS